MADLQPTARSEIRQRIDLERDFQKAVRGIPKVALPTPPTLLHYTSLDSCYSILKSHSIRASRAEQSNDTAELTLAASVVADALKEREAKTALSQSVVEQVQELLTQESIHTLVTCFTEPRQVKESHQILPADILSMWRSYGNTGSGVAIHFDGPRLQSLVNSAQGAISSGRLLKVIYDPDEQFELIKATIRLAGSEILNKLPDRSPKRLAWAARTIAGELGSFAAMFKHIGFSEENEWRLVFNIGWWWHGATSFQLKDGLQRSCVHLIVRKQYADELDENGERRTSGLQGFFSEEENQFSEDLFVDGDWSEERALLPVSAITVGPSNAQRAAAVSIADWARFHRYSREEALDVQISQIPFRT